MRKYWKLCWEFFEWRKNFCISNFCLATGKVKLQVCREKTNEFFLHFMVKTTFNFFFPSIKLYYICYPLKYFKLLKQYFEYFKNVKLSLKFINFSPLLIAWRVHTPECNRYHLLNVLVENDVWFVVEILQVIYNAKLISKLLTLSNNSTIWLRIFL